MRSLYATDVTIPEAMPPGAVILASGDTPRFHGFTVSLLHLLQRGLPEGSAFLWNQGLNLCPTLNDAVARALEKGAAWCWIIGDDHTFAPDIIVKLWSHQRPIVAPLVLRRQPPYLTVMSRNGQNLPLSADLRGLVPVDAVGSAGLLVQRQVFEAVGPQPFEIGDAYVQHEDITFCHKARRAGFEIAVDVDAALGHIVPVEVWPARHDETHDIRPALLNPLGMRLT